MYLMLSLLFISCNSDNVKEMCESGIERNCECTSGVKGVQTCIGNEFNSCACWQDDKDCGSDIYLCW